MLLTPSQQSRFFRDWSSVLKHQKQHGPGLPWTREQAEAHRHALLQRAGFQSLRDVDRAAGFDRVLAELGVMRDNLARTSESFPVDKIFLPSGSGTQSHDNSPGYRRRILWIIRKIALHLGGDPYIAAIARDRFGITSGLSSIEDLDTRQLHQLMMTLAARHQAAQERAELRKADAMSEAQDSTEAWWEQESLKEAEAQEFWENVAVERQCHDESEEQTHSNPF